MIPPTSTISDEERAAHEEEFGQFVEYTFDEVKGILKRIPDEELQKVVYETAFSPDGPAQKPTTRPRYQPFFQADLIYRALAEDPTDRDLLVQFNIIATEYYDLLDDVADGDLSADEVPTVIVTTQALVPVMVELLNEMGQDALGYWPDPTKQLIRAVFLEEQRTTSKETYLDVVEQLGYMYGFEAGLAAVLAGADEEQVQHAQRLGKRSHDIVKVIGDLKEIERGEDESWNVTDVMSIEEIRSTLERWQSEFIELADVYQEPYASRLQTVLSYDFDEFIDASGDEFSVVMQHSST